MIEIARGRITNQSGDKDDTMKSDGDLKPIAPDKSLHQIKDMIQVRYMSEQCRQLNESWGQIVAKTRECAPIRKRDFKLDRDRASEVRKSSLEARWERALWCIWGPGMEGNLGELLPGVCQSFVTYQMPLQEHYAQSGVNRKWGKVDLLGKDEDGRPALIELKRSDAEGENPLRAITEIAAYGIAFRKAWEEGGLKQEWSESVAELSKALGTINLVVLGTNNYWEVWNEYIARMEGHLDTLKNKLWHDGFALHFASVCCSGIIH